MKPTSRTCLCLLAVITASATFAAGASAVPLPEPEFGRCEFLAGGTSVYSNGECTVPGAPNEYEWFGGLGPVPAIADGTFVTKGGKAVFQTVPDNNGQFARLTCIGESGGGEIVDEQEVEGVVETYRNCFDQFPGMPQAKCNSPGNGVGEITTNTLEGELGYIANVNPVGLDLESSTGVLFEFECGASGLIQVMGSVIAPITPINIMALKAKLKYKAHNGIQKPEALTSGAKANQKDTLEILGVQAGLTTTQKVTYAPADAGVEIRTQG